MWRLRCVTFSSTSRLIPLFNLFSSRCVSRHPPLLTSAPFHRRRGSPLCSIYPLRRGSWARERIPSTSSSSVSLSFPFLAVLPSTDAYFSPPCPSVLVQRSLDFVPPLSLTGTLSFSRPLLRSQHRPSPSSGPTIQLSSDSSWRLSSLGCEAVARLCAIQSGLQGRGIKQTP